MAQSLSIEPIISKHVLGEFAETRLREAKALLGAELPSGAIYLAGYAVECLLKVAICTTLRWNDLLGAFRIHDLDTLLLYSGLSNELRSTQPVFANFVSISSAWTMSGNNSVRYRDPSLFDIQSARAFLHCVADGKTGVAPWLRRRVS